MLPGWLTFTKWAETDTLLVLVWMCTTVSHPARSAFQVASWAHTTHHKRAGDRQWRTTHSWEKEIPHPRTVAEGSNMLYMSSLGRILQPLLYFVNGSAVHDDHSASAAQMSHSLYPSGLALLQRRWLPAR